MKTDTPPTASLSDAELQRIAKASNTFGLDLYAKLRDEKGNLAMSPASISTALAMTWAGAKGETEAQMRKVMHFDGTPAEIAPLAGKLSSYLEDPNRAVKLRIANRLFGEKTYSFEPGYLELTKTAFDAPLDPVDFRKNFEGARKHINSWVEGETEKRIKNLIPPRGVDAETSLALVNAIYFLGDWADPFRKEATSDAEFTVAQGKKKKVPTMHRTAHYGFAEKGGVKALEMTYKGNDTSMVVLLPKDEASMAAFEKGLTVAKVNELASALTAKKVEVSLPRFEIDPASSVALADQLKALGMTTAFDRKKADFTGIANPPSPADRLFIGQVFHKAFVKVDEKGTEAAAATAVVMPRAGSAARPEPPEVFNADHPFVYLIRDKKSGLILFMGRVSDPTSK